MGYFFTNIVVYGILFALAVMGYNAVREMRNKKRSNPQFSFRVFPFRAEVRTFVKKLEK